MIRYRFIIITIISFIACFGVTRWITAQTWSDPTDTPPNSDIPNISALVGDNLGFVAPPTTPPGSHRAEFDLDMAGYPILGIGNLGGVGPALNVSATGPTGVGLHVTSNKIGLYAESSVSVIGAVNRGNAGTGGPGLIADSGGGAPVSAKLYGTTILQDSSPTASGRLQIGSLQANSLGVVSAGATGSSLYYGSTLLCDPTKVNCGYATTESYRADNLGFNSPHIATKNLNLNGNRIINVVSKAASTTPEVYQTGQAPGVLVTNNGGVHNGTPIALYGATSGTSDFHAGIYGLGSAGPGIMAASASGEAAEIYGKFNTLANDTIGVGDEYVSFGPITGTNRLRTASLSTGLSTASDSLYWGDMLLCDPTSTTCGWQASGGGGPVSEQWELSGQTLYYQNTNPNVNDLDRTNVGIAVANPNTNLQYQLQVTGLARATGGYLGTLLVNNVTVNNELEVGTDVTVSNNVTLTGVAGLKVDGKIYVHANGIKIGSAVLTGAKLQQLIDACDSRCL